ncbi:MAG: MFS transporter [Candidatus Aminicenantes bacterium]|nr:MAG: MFS transporter [Candidatus Aminicenantes bacterium]
MKKEDEREGLMSAKFRLSVMMFLQYAIWGAWAPVLSDYLINKLGFSGAQVGAIYSLLPLATILSPFIGGQLADRYFPTQKVIAFLQLFGGGLLIYTSTVTHYPTLMGLMLFYSLLYAPTLALTNSIAFINLENSEKEFGIIRVWGTIGWIVAGLSLAGWRYLGEALPSFTYRGDTLLLAGLFSLIMGIFSFKLPHTPPQKDAPKPWAFLEAVKMLRDKNFLIFIIISFVVATELQFYYVLTAPYLTSKVIGVSSSAVSGVMVIAQIAEIFVMALLLPYFLPRYGIKKTMVIGVLAWPIRYIIFVIAYPAWLVIASLALHGFCYVFFFTAAFIYVDEVAPRDIRASAQSLIAIVVLGLGNFLGSLFSGWIQTVFTTEAGTNWRGVFSIPAVLTILCALAFVAFFREKKKLELT